MKNTLLLGALFTALSTQIHADVDQPLAPTIKTDTTTAAPITNVQTPPAQPQGIQLKQPVAPAIPPVPAPVQPVINCDYKIPAEMKNIDEALVRTWSEKATMQAFDFDPLSIDSQIQKLQACFTDTGWSGFNIALKNSGNVEAIKSQKLTVSSQIDGPVQLVQATDGQWNFALPLQVVYQNDKEKVTQLLTIKLTVARKINGDLGIMQMIATPRPPIAPATTATTPTEASTTKPLPTTNVLPNTTTNPQQPANNPAQK